MCIGGKARAREETSHEKTILFAGYATRPCGVRVVGIGGIGGVRPRNYL